MASPIFLSRSNEMASIAASSLHSSPAVTKAASGDASVMTAALASTAAVVFAAIVVGAIVLFRRRQYLSLDNIESDLERLERSLGEWREQTSERDQAVRRSWHGEMSAWRDYVEPVAAPRQVRERWQRRSDLVDDKWLNQTAKSHSALTKNSRVAPNKAVGNGDVLVPKSMLPVPPRKARLSVAALRELDGYRNSFLEDARIKPFTLHGDLEADGASAGSKEGNHPTPSAATMKEDSVDMVSADVPPSISHVVRDQAPSLGCEAEEALHLNQETIHVAEFDVAFPMPSPTWPNLDIAASGVEENDSRPCSQPYSMTTDDTEDDAYEVDADAMLLSPLDMTSPPVSGKQDGMRGVNLVE